MRSLMLSIVLCASALAGQPASAQTSEDMYSNMNAAMEAAQAQAVHPGDDALTCDQLQDEMAGTAMDPAVQSFAVESGAWGQEQLAQANAAQGRMRAQMGLNLFMGIASSFIPGMGYAQMAQQQMMMAQQQQQMDAQMAQMAAMTARVTPIMPQLMRGQRVYELAQAQQCPFAQQEQQAQ